MLKGSGLRLGIYRASLQAFIAEAVYTLSQSPKPEYVRDVELEYLRKLSNSFSSLLQVLGSLMVGVSVVEVLKHPRP